MRKQTLLCKPIGPSHSGTLVIERQVFDLVIGYARAAGLKEVCGFLLVRRVATDYFLVIDDSLHIPDQYVGIGGAEPTPRGESAQMDIEDETDEDVFRLLWHSHVAGAADFSSTDLGTHQMIGQTTGFDAMFFMVVNQHGEASANLEIYSPFRLGTQLRLIVREPYEALDLNALRDDIERACHPFPKPPVVTTIAPKVTVIPARSTAPAAAPTLTPFSNVTVIDEGEEA